jgi:hypothetical protein
MSNFLCNLSIFIGLCVFGYFVFSSMGSIKEGLENATTTTAAGTNSNGVAGSAAAYGANIKAQVIKFQDTVLISKYRADYENVVINLDELVNNLMLQTALTIDQSKPHEGLAKLVGLNNAKAALNNVMKFIDKT